MYFPFRLQKERVIWMFYLKGRDSRKLKVFQGGFGRDSVKFEGFRGFLGGYVLSDVSMEGEKGMECKWMHEGFRGKTLRKFFEAGVTSDMSVYRRFVRYSRCTVLLSVLQPLIVPWKFHYTPQDSKRVSTRRPLGVANNKP